MTVNESAFSIFPKRTTPRLTLTSLERRDSQEISNLFGSDAWLRYVPRERLDDPGQAMEKVRVMSTTFDERSAIWWAFRLRASGEFLGYGGLFEINREDHNAEIGYGFKPDYWGQGYASEAVGSIVEFGFQDLGLRRTYGLIDPDNIASIKVLEKLGFEREGVLRSSAFARGRYWDQCLYAKVRE